MKLTDQEVEGYIRTLHGKWRDAYWTSEEVEIMVAGNIRTFTAWCREKGVNDRQKELAEKHGTPEQFENAIWRACDDLFISTYEANVAVKKYRAEWDAAGQAPATGERTA